MEYRLAVIVEAVGEDENDSAEVFRVNVDQQEDLLVAKAMADRMDCCLYGGNMKDRDFKVLLHLLMVSDPWPLTRAEEVTLKEYADRQAQKRGHDDWVDAYHFYRVPRKKQS